MPWTVVYQIVDTFVRAGKPNHGLAALAIILIGVIVVCVLKQA